MSTPQSMLTRGKLYYTAGIIDGEGSICLYYNQRRTQWAMEVVVVNTNKLLMDTLLDWYGGTISTRMERGNWKTCYRWRLSGNQAISLLRQLEHLLSLKRKQAKLLLEFWEKRTIRNPKDGKLSQEEIDLRNSYVQKMHELNRKCRKAPAETKRDDA